MGFEGDRDLSLFGLAKEVSDYYTHVLDEMKSKCWHNNQIWHRVSDYSFSCMQVANTWILEHGFSRIQIYIYSFATINSLWKASIPSPLYFCISNRGTWCSIKGYPMHLTTIYYIYYINEALSCWMMEYIAWIWIFVLRAASSHFRLIKRNRL